MASGVGAGARGTIREPRPLVRFALVVRGHAKRRWRLLRQPHRWLRRSPVVYSVRRRLISRAGPPAGYWEETANRWCRDVPDAYRDLAAGLSGGDGPDVARGLVGRIAAARRTLTGHSTDSVSALRAVLAGSGTCSDVSQVVTAALVARGVPVREWGAVTADGHGHAFCEVWSDRLGRWCLLDVTYGCSPVDGRGEPVGVLALLERAAGVRDDLSTARCPIPVHDPDPFGWSSGRYLDDGVRFFLVARNQIFAQDPVLRALRRAPLPVAHLVLLAVGRYQRWWVYGPDDVEAIRVVAPRTDGVEPRARLPLAS